MEPNITTRIARPKRTISSKHWDLVQLEITFSNMTMRINDLEAVVAVVTAEPAEPLPYLKKPEQSDSEEARIAELQKGEGILLKRLQKLEAAFNGLARINAIRS